MGFGGVCSLCFGGVDGIGAGLRTGKGVFKRRVYLLDVVIAQSPSIFQLLAGEDQTLLIGGNALFVLNLGLDVVDCVGRFDLEGDGLTCEGFDEAWE